MANVNYANRGRSFEELIEYANEQYKAKGVALVQKVATPWTVIREGKQIVSAFPAEKSTVDYIGVTKINDGTVPLAFDAKQCKLKTSFPLKNIEQHQLDFLAAWRFQGGTSFVIIEMTTLGKIYKVEFEVIARYWWLGTIAGGAKSIPIKDFAKFKAVGQAGGIVLDYLELY